MIDSMIEPKPGEGGGINTINQEGPGLQKEPDAGAALPGRDPDFECAEETNQVRTWTTEMLERDCALDIKVWLAKGFSRYGASRGGW
jgi:hypothetical protein